MTNEEKLYYYLSVNFAATKKELAHYLNVSEKSITNYLKNIKHLKFQFKNKIEFIDNFYYLNNIDVSAIKLSTTEYMLWQIFLENAPLYPKSIIKKFALSDSTWKRKLHQVKTKIKTYNNKYELHYDKKNDAYIDNIADNEKEIIALDLLRNTIILFAQEKLASIASLILKYFADLKTTNREEVILNIFILAHRAQADPKAKVINNFIADLNYIFEKPLNEMAQKQILKYLNLITDYNFKKQIFVKLQKHFKIIDQKYGTNLKTHHNFLNRIAEHVAIALISKRYQVKNNFINYSIKSNYPFAYLIGIDLKKMLEKNYHYYLNDNELALLAIHIVSGLNYAIKTISVYLHSDLGPAIAALLKKQITQHFPELKIVENPKLSHIIISTTFVNTYYDKKVIVVKPILQTEDIAKIKLFLKKRLFLNQNIKMIKLIDNTNLSFKTDLVLTYLLKEINLKNKGLYQLLKNREQISTTNLNNGIAIPHALIKTKAWSGIYIFKLKKEINWFSGNKVQLIIISLIYEKNVDAIRETFANLSQAIIKLAKSDIAKLKNEQEVKEILGA